MNWMFYLKTTETCNLNCKHCFTNGINGPKIYWDTFKVINWLYRFATQKYNQNDTVHCEFHGGEPFLVPARQIQEVIDKTEFFYDKITWGATTNLVFKLYDEHIDLIKHSFGNRIATSWDPKIRFTNHKQYELWHTNVKRLLNEGITVKLFISVTQDTVNIDPSVMLRWIRRLGVHEVSFERLTHNGNANKFPDIFPANKDQDDWFLKLHEASEKLNARNWFRNESLEIIYDKFETGFTAGGTFCRDCEEKIFTINADGTISGCPNSAPEFNFGTIDDSIGDLINSPIRLENIACERSRNSLCYDCDVFTHCGGDCHQLAWQDNVCGAPKSLMRELNKQNKKVWMIKEL